MMHIEGPASTNEYEISVDGLLERLVVEFSGPLYRQAISIVRNHASAQDVVQDTLVRAWQGYESYRGDAPLRGWVMRIGHNTAISHLRKTRDTPTDPAHMPEIPGPNTDSDSINRLTVEAVWTALADTDELSRAIMVLKDVEGHSYEEIVEITGSTLGTVKSRLFRTRRMLADRLKEWK